MLNDFAKVSLFIDIPWNIKRSNLWVSCSLINDPYARKIRNNGITYERSKEDFSFPNFEVDKDWEA